MPSISPSLARGTRVRLAWRVAVGLLALVAAVAASAQSWHIGAATPGLSEAGIPPFTIRGHEAFGLRTQPTDLEELEDGRILLYAPRQISTGDGTRWQTFDQEENDPYVPSANVAVDKDGGIYIGLEGAVGKVTFTASGEWKINSVVSLPAEGGVAQPVLRIVQQVNSEWYWHGDSGRLLRWRPGSKPEHVGAANTLEHVTALGEHRYFSDRTSGSLQRISPTGNETIPFVPVVSPGSTITASAPLNQEELLVGTAANGLMIFNGKTVRPFLGEGVLGRKMRVNALCALGDGKYVAGIENQGLYFFDSDGRILQVLERGLDHRLAHIRGLWPTSGGIVWGLLDEGVLRVEFPAPLTNYVPLIGTGVSSAHPYRHKGELWMLADGRVRRARYDETGRLVELPEVTLRDRFVYAFDIVDGIPIAGTERGAYRWTEEQGWINFIEEKRNLRPVSSHRLGGKCLYVAVGEVGWLSFDGADVHVESFPAPELAETYNAQTDAHGITWLELGNGKLGRIHVIDGKPLVRIFGAREGIPQGWAQVFTWDGTIRFNISDQVLRFDDVAERFVNDASFHQTFPGISRVIGRPVRDAAGRVWITADGGIKIFERHEDQWILANEKLPAGFQPYSIGPQDDGVMWLHAAQKLMRYDPALNLHNQQPLRAYISNLVLPSSKRLLDPREGPIEMAYRDNIIVANYGATGGGFSETVTFEVMLEGADPRWVEAGNVGSSVFNRLKEGRYKLHVRPQTGSGYGEEAVVEFRVHPPWYRSTAAYFAYIILATLGISGIAWFSSYLQRRENARLEKLVSLRTHELNETNFRLGHQVEEIRRLSQAIEQSPVGVALTRPDGIITFANPRFCDLCGYQSIELVGRNLRTLRGNPFSSSLETQIESTVASGEAWHGELTNQTKDGRTVQVRTTISPIRSPDGNIRSHLILEEDITEWVTEQERRKKLESQLLQAQKLDALGTLAGGIAHDFNNILTGILGYCELATLDSNDTHRTAGHLEEIRRAGLRAKDLIGRILAFSRQSNATLTPLDLSATVAEALKFLRASIPATIEIIPQLGAGNILGDSTQIHQVVANLCTNAMHAMRERSGQIRVSVTQTKVTQALASEIPDLAPGDYMKLEVADSGHGMDQNTLDRVFDPFFTTKQTGEGTGLGLAIVRGIVASHHGALRVKSVLESGTTFELYFPLSAESPAPKLDPTQVPVGAGQEILVVDDEIMIGNFVANRLSRMGYKASVHSTPASALEAFNVAPERYHALITDLTMPGMTGMELLTLIRQRRSIPVIIMSGYGIELLRNQPEPLEHYTILPKPFNGNDLNRAVQEVIGRTSV